jgi:transposase
VDQSGFYLLPTVVRTYAPMGQTPILHEQLTRDHLSVISGITLEGKLYMMEQERAFKSQDVVRYLRHVLRQMPGKLLIIWDGSPIHSGQAVKEFLASGAENRLQLEQLPGYAPDLNPDEGVWKHLKYVELKNVCCQSLSELRIELRKAKERLRRADGDRRGSDELSPCGDTPTSRSSELRMAASAVEVKRRENERSLSVRGGRVDG